MDKNLYKKICNIVLDILIVLIGLVLLGTIYNTIQVKILHKNKADFFGFTTFEVQTGSMAPTINASDLIIVKKSDKAEIKDIITYEKNGEYITHRVVDAYKNSYVTKGDANNSKDEPISKEQIVGKVVKIIPGFGIIRKTILNPIVLITLIITVYLISLLFKKNEDRSKIDKLILNFVKRDKPLIQKVTIEDDGLVYENIIDNSLNLEEDNNEKVTEEIKEDNASEELEVKETIADNEDVTLKEINEVLDEEQDMDKTMFFRKILVDPIDFEILEEEEEDIIPEEIKSDIEEEVTAESSEYQVKLEYLNKRKKKFNNIVDKFFYLKEEEINDILKTITNNEKLKVNEANIKDSFLSSYLDVRYYNRCGDVNAEYNNKNIFTRISEELNKIGANLINKYKGNDKSFEDKVNKYYNLFLLTMYLEDYFVTEDDTVLKIDAYKKKMNKYLYSEYKNNINSLIKDIIKIQKVYSKIIKENLEKLNTNMFTLDYNTLTKKNIFALDLKHNINFSKIYSNYIVDKTYDEGIIAEDKILVTINLLSATVIRNMIEKKFKYNYVLYIPSSLLSKDNKLNKILKLLNDEMLKNSVVLLVNYTDALKSKTLLKNIKKQGYKIAFTINDDNPIKVKDVATLKLATYIFVDKKINKEINVNKILDKDLNTTIILEDILPKVGIEKGE